MIMMLMKMMVMIMLIKIIKTVIMMMMIQLQMNSSTSLYCSTKFPRRSCAQRAQSAASCSYGGGWKGKWESSPPHTPHAKPA